MLTKEAGFSRVSMHIGKDSLKKSDNQEGDFSRNGEKLLDFQVAQMQ